MPARRPKDIGTDAERAIVRYLQGAGWPHAERRALRGHADAGDITGTPGLAWSVKGGQYAHYPSDRAISDWLTELDKQVHNAGADHGVLVTKRYGKSDPGRWWAWAYTSTLAALVGGTWPSDQSWMVTHLDQAVTVLRSAGYGSEATPCRRPPPEVAALVKEVTRR